MIATPLGNLGDMTQRAKECLGSLRVLFAEDSRELAKLLELCGIPRDGKRIHSYAAHNMKEATRKVLQILEEGNDVGFVSDRGTPGVSDPGALLAREAMAAGFGVLPIPGPSSVAAALSVSGFPADRFLFLGFLPPSPGEREKRWDLVRSAGMTACLFESPKRIRETLTELKSRFPEGAVFLAREMTKLHESYDRRALAELDPEGVPERGEFVVVLDPGPVPASASAWEEEVRLRAMPDKAWAKAIAARHDVAAHDVYNALQRERRGDTGLKKRADFVDKE